MEHIKLFNTIAPLYGLFFGFQQKMYRRILKQVSSFLDLSPYRSVVDVGCGTGALASVLAENRFLVTGVDASSRMIEQAKKRTGKHHISYICADGTEGIPVDEESFDIAICSYVAHGLEHSARLKLYREMCRISKWLVIIHDYTDRRSVLTDVVETLEGGAYFQFINDAPGQMKRDFCNVQVLPVGKRSAWYVCRKGECT